MAHIYADRVKETTLTTGTGSYSLAGAGAAFQTFSAVMVSSDTCYYAIEMGNDWEVGLGTLLAPGVLGRTTIYDSSNGGSAVNWPSGSKTIALTAAAQYFSNRQYTDVDIDTLVSAQIDNHTHVEVDITDLDKYTQNEINNHTFDAGYF